VELLYFFGLAVVAYFLGGLNGAIITSRLIYKDDIRKHGSGNAGLTNFFRTYGSRVIVLVLLIDVLKPAVPVILGGMLLESALTFGAPTERVILGRTFGGVFAMLGHAYPCLYRFKGGKAVLAGGTAALFIDIRVFAVIMAVFVLVVFLTRYVSLGSVLAGIALPTAFVIFHLGLWSTVLAFCGGLLVVCRHHGNIARLLKGEERKLSFGKKER